MESKCKFFKYNRTVGFKNELRNIILVLYMPHIVYYFQGIFRHITRLISLTSILRPYFRLRTYSTHPPTNEISFIASVLVKSTKNDINLMQCGCAYSYGIDRNARNTILLALINMYRYILCVYVWSSVGE